MKRATSYGGGGAFVLGDGIESLPDVVRSPEIPGPESTAVVDPAGSSSESSSFS